MPHIFRFHKGRNNNITDWKASDKIEPADVREIMDKTNIPTTSAGSSIPTPIARMFLFKTAFEIMAAQVGDDQVESKSVYYMSPFDMGIGCTKIYGIHILIIAINDIFHFGYDNTTKIDVIFEEF